MKYIFIYASVIFAMFSISFAKEVKVLTIGNSFANSVFKYLPDIAKSVPDCDLVIERANHGGCELHRHWRYIKEEEEDKSVRNYREHKTTLRAILSSRKWDIVTIQQASHESWKPESYFPYAKNIFDYIKKYSPSAEVVIQQTWSYRADDPRLREGGKWGIDQTEMFKRVEKSYAAAAKKLNIRVIPSGQAVQNYRTQEKDPFVVYPVSELKAARWPDLPKQSGDVIGNMSWKKLNGKMIIKTDSIHLNQRGEYLQACVWFGFLFDKDPTEIKFVPDTIADNDAANLRAIAKKTLEEFKQPRNEK